MSRVYDAPVDVLWREYWRQDRAMRDLAAATSDEDIAAFDAARDRWLAARRELEAIEEWR